MENAWKCVNVFKSNQFTNQTNPENREIFLCNLPCGAMPPHFNEFSAVSKDDIMPAAWSREQFCVKNRSDRTMLVLC